MQKRLEKKLNLGELVPTWVVPIDGYKVSKDYTVCEAFFMLQKNKDSILFTDPPHLILNKDTGFTLCNQLGNKLLHRLFAGLRTNNDIVKFANKYGLLGQAIRVIPYGVKETSDIRTAESLKLWEKRIHEVGLFVYLWDLINKRDAGKLGKIVSWKNSKTIQANFYWLYDSKKDNYKLFPGIEYKSPIDFQKRYPNITIGIEGGYYYQSIANAWPKIKHKSYLIDMFDYGNVIDPTLYFLCQIINNYLKDSFSLNMTSIYTREIHTTVSTLDDAIWLHFLLEIGGMITPVKCTYCKKWFHSNDPRAMYCSKACKTAASRLRKKNKELLIGGKQ